MGQEGREKRPEDSDQGIGRPVQLRSSPDQPFREVLTGLTACASSPSLTYGDPHLLVG